MITCAGVRGHIFLRGAVSRCIRSDSPRILLYSWGSATQADHSPLTLEPGRRSLRYVERGEESSESPSRALGPDDVTAQSACSEGLPSSFVSGLLITRPPPHVPDVYRQASATGGGLRREYSACVCLHVCWHFDEDKEKEEKNPTWVSQYLQKTQCSGQRAPEGD